MAGDKPDPDNRRFLVMIYESDRTRIVWTEASCYADAVANVAPGNDAFKVEVVGGG